MYIYIYLYIHAPTPAHLHIIMLKKWQLHHSLCLPVSQSQEELDDQRNVGPRTRTAPWTMDFTLGNDGHNES